MKNFIKTAAHRFSYKADDFKKSVAAEMVDFDAFTFRVRAFGVDGANIYLTNDTMIKWYNLVRDFIPLAHYYNCRIGNPFNIKNDDYIIMLLDYLSIDDAYILLQFNNDGTFCWNVDTPTYKKYFNN